MDPDKTIGIINKGSVGASAQLLKGPITKGNIIDLSPFKTTAIHIEL